MDDQDDTSGQTTPERDANPQTTGYHQKAAGANCSHLCVTRVAIWVWGYSMEWKNDSGDWIISKEIKSRNWCQKIDLKPSSNGPEGSSHPPGKLLSADGGEPSMYNSAMLANPERYTSMQLLRATVLSDKNEALQFQSHNKNDLKRQLTIEKTICR